MKSKTGIRQVQRHTHRVRHTPKHRPRPPKPEGVVTGTSGANYCIENGRLVRSPKEPL